MKHLINNWLQGKRNYGYGSILYKQFGTDDILKNLFSGPATDYTQEKLLAAMKTLLIENSPAAVKPPVIVAYNEMPEDADQVLIALRNEWMPFYTEMNIKRHELDKYIEDEFLNDPENTGLDVFRGKLAMEILNLEKQCMAVWAKRDHYLKYKVLPGKTTTDEPVIDKVEAVLRMALLKGYIRREKALVKKHPGKANYAARLKLHTEELEKLIQIHGQK